MWFYQPYLSRWLPSETRPLFRFGSANVADQSTLCNICYYFFWPPDFFQKGFKCKKSFDCGQKIKEQIINKSLTSSLQTTSIKYYSGCLVKTKFGAGLLNLQHRWRVQSHKKNFGCAEHFRSWQSHSKMSTGLKRNVQYLWFHSAPPYHSLECACYKCRNKS